MKKRSLPLLLAVAFGLSGATSLLAQRDQIARMPNGKPDLSGTFNAATLTPLERPRELADKPFLTVEEAEALQAQEREFAANANSATDATRDAPPEGGAAVVGFEETACGGNRFGAGNVGGYNWFWVDRGTEAFAVDGQFPTSIVIDPPDGRIPPITEEARKARMEQAGRRRPNDGTAWWEGLDMHGPYDGPEDLGISERCLTGFTGAAPTFPSLYNNYKRIVQTDTHVMILIEMVHDARVVRMNSEHPPADQRFWLGDSIGWWEGDTLVVETTNFREDAARRGSADMKVIERFTPQVGGSVIYNFTVDDPSTYTAPWTGEYLWKASNDQKVFEYACHEGNYAMEGILKGARLLEADARGELPTESD